MRCEGKMKEVCSSKSQGSARFNVRVLGGVDDRSLRDDTSDEKEFRPSRR